MTLFSILLPYAPLQMLSLDSRIYQNGITDHVDTYIVVVVEDLSINLLFQLSSMDFVQTDGRRSSANYLSAGGSANENADAIVPRF